MDWNSVTFWRLSLQLRHGLQQPRIGGLTPVGAAVPARAARRPPGTGQIEKSVPGPDRISSVGCGGKGAADVFCGVTRKPTKTYLRTPPKVQGEIVVPPQQAAVLAL
eukprot:3039391-Rhodomonas_salina.2